MVKGKVTASKTRKTFSSNKKPAPSVNGKRIVEKTDVISSAVSMMDKQDISHGKKQASSPPFVKKPLFIIVVIAAILVGLLYYFRGQFVVALVNGQPIWRFTLIKELEKQAGKQVLDGFVTKTLVLQEAKKQNVAVSDEEVNEEIKKFEENFKGQGQDLNQFLESQGMTQEDFRERIEIQKIVEKIVAKDIEVTDQEVSDHLAKNKDFLPKDAKEDELKNTAREQLRQQKINEKIQSWIKSLRDNAKITYFSK